MDLVRRMRHHGPAILTEISALAQRHDAVNLGQGFPDTDGPPEMLAAAAQAIASGQNQYPPLGGRPELLAAIAAHQQHWYGLRVDPASEVLVTVGATEALAATILAMSCARAWRGWPAWPGHLRGEPSDDHGVGRPVDCRDS
ncbi:MAG TPA: aminotransferase class I/II-fold pyridoxal phosphate-dependent enzyme [Propionicimonas sp.]|jgi:N-succinyldiaminopimelate aminotransferase